LYICIRCFITKITLFLQVINYEDIWPQICTVTILTFRGHMTCQDRDRKYRKYDIPLATGVSYGRSMMTMHGYVGRATGILGYPYYYYANRVLASFCLNFTKFVAMATRVGRGRL